LKAEGEKDMEKQKQKLYHQVQMSATIDVPELEPLFRAISGLPEAPLRDTIKKWMMWLETHKHLTETQTAQEGAYEDLTKRLKEALHMQKDAVAKATSCRTSASAAAVKRIKNPVKRRKALMQVAMETHSNRRVVNRKAVDVLRDFCRLLLPPSRSIPLHELFLFEHQPRPSKTEEQRRGNDKGKKKSEERKTKGRKGRSRANQPEPQSEAAAAAKSSGYEFRPNLLDYRPHLALHTALIKPKSYLQPNDIAAMMTKKSKKDETVLTSKTEDIAIAYSLLMEMSKNVNLHDWYQAFAVIHGNGKKLSPKELQARFAQASSELQFLGLIKPSTRKVDHVVQATEYRPKVQ